MRLLKAAHRAAPFVLAAAGMLLACTEAGRTPLAPDPRGPDVPVALAIEPRFDALQDPFARPITRIRVQVLSEPGGTLLTGATEDVDPAAGEWKLSQELKLPDGVGRTVRVTAELMSGPASVEWSGRSDVVDVEPGDAVVLQLTFYRGPLSNLDATRLDVRPDSASVTEGDTLTLAAVLEGTEDGRAFWLSRDTAVATVDAAGRVRGRAPGTARVVAVAGPLTDSAVVVVLPRIGRIVVDPDSAATESLGDERSFTARVLDVRGDEVAGVPLRWSAADSRVAESLGGGAFRAAGRGRTAITVTTGRAPGIAGRAVFVARQLVASVAIEPDSVSFAALGATRALVAVARDARGNVVADARCAWTSSDPAVASVDTAGMVTAVGGGSAAVTAACGGVAASVPVRVSQRVVRLELRDDGAALDAIGAEQQWTVVGFDANGQVVPGLSATWRSSDSTVARVDDSGRVVAVGSGTATITATVDGVSVSRVVTVRQAPDELVVAGGNGQSGAAGAVLPQPVKVRVTDAGGRGVAGAEVAWTIASGGGSVSASRSATDASGIAEVDWTLGSAAGANTLVASVAGLTPVTFTATATATDTTGTGTATDTTTTGTATDTTTTGTAERLEIVSGDGGTSPVAGTRTLRVKATDAGGDPVRGVAVSWAAAAGSGSVDTAASTTDTAGIALATWTLDTIAGVQHATATAAGLDGSPLTFSVTAQPGAPSTARSTLVVDPTSILANGSATATVTVRLKDRYGNDVGASGGTVALSTTAGSLSAVTDHDDGSYTATLTAPSAAGPATVSGTLAGSALAASATVHFTAGGAAKFVVTGSTTQTAGASQTITITALDADGNTATGYSGVESVVLGGAVASPAGRAPTASDSAGAAVAFGTGTALRFSGGVATTSVVLYAAETADLAVTDGSLATAEADRLPVVVAAAAADHLGLATQPSTAAESGVALARQPVVQLRDAFGNVVAEADIAVTAALTAGDGTLGGTTTVQTDTAGRAAFTDLSITGAIGDRTLGFTAVGLTPATSDIIALASRPDAPTGLAASAGAGQAALSWTAPAGDGGSAIVDYRVEYKASASADWLTFSHGASAADTITVTGLANGTAYDFRVAAVNALGAGAPSAPASATPRTVPGAPTALVATTPTSSEVALAWAAPASDGGTAIVDYLVEFRRSTDAVWSTFGSVTTTSATVTGLTAGTTYDFRVSARNAAGTGVASAVASATPGTPGAPTGLSVTTSQSGTSGTANQQQAVMSWTAPSDPGGSAITDYRIEYRRSTDTSWTTVSHTASTAPSYTLGGLVNGTTYDFRVSAKNAVGVGAPSATVTKTTTAPSERLECITPGSSNSSASSGTITPCGSVGIGDIILVPVVLANPSTTAKLNVVPSGSAMDGWTELATTLDGASQTTVFYKIADENDVGRGASSYAFSWTDASGKAANVKWAITLVAYHDASGAAPQAVTTTGSSGTITAPAVTVDADRTLLYVFATQTAMSSTTATVAEWTASDALYRETSAGSNNANSVAVLTADVDVTAASSIPARTATTATMSTDNHWSGWTLILQP